ncbi:hypothetical protein AMTRI_Chr13g121480 [Amborella trichopoda]
MEIPHGKRFVQAQRGSTGMSFRSNQFLGSEKDTGYINDLARQSTLRGHSSIKIRENPIQFSIKTEFCKLSPELEDHFEILEHIQGKMSEKRNIQDHKHKLLTAKYELRRKLYRAFCKDPDLPSDMQDKHRYKLSLLPRNSSFAQVRNRCISTSRPRSVYEFFCISCIVFNGLASRGPLMGIKKLSW